MTLHLHEIKPDRVIMEMSTAELSLIATMLGYSCAAAQYRRHWRLLKTFRELSKGFLEATTVEIVQEKVS
jgi:hypothetical protein